MASNLDMLKFSEAMLLNLRAILGERAYAVVMRHVIDDYLGSEMDIHSAITNRPNVFESALIDLLGQAGMILLRQIVAVTTLGEFNYSKSGDLAKCMILIRRS